MRTENRARQHPREHWEGVYDGRRSEELSWFQERAELSLELIAAGALPLDAAILDVGGGDSRLVDGLLELGYSDLTVLDLSQHALDRARQRLGERASEVTWIAEDVIHFQPSRRYDLWHDRAAFHFLTSVVDRRAYVRALRGGLRRGGQLVLATFSLEGPPRCSGLPVERYDTARLAEALGADFRLAESRPHEHRTPAGRAQSFLYTRFVRG